MASYVYKDSSLQCVSLGMDELVKVIDFYVPVKFTAEEKVEFGYLVAERHSHDNKDILDKLGYDEDTNNLTYNGEAVHKEGLTSDEVDFIVDQKITKLGNVTEEEKKEYAVEKAHEHKNKEILDKFDYDSVNGRVMYDGTAMTGSGMLQNEVESLVQEKISNALKEYGNSYAPITSTEKSDYDQAVINTHTHNNFGVLEAISYDDTIGKLTYNGDPICKGLEKQAVSDLIDETVPIKLKNHTVEEYDQAVEESHTHYNNDALDRFSYNNGKLFFNGKKVAFDTSSDSENESIESGVYGFTIDQSESDPSKMITYIGKNSNYTPAKMDCDNGIFNYGSWENVWFIKNLKPVMLNYDGTIAYELDKNDYSKKKDGTPSDITDTSFGGNVMIGIPKVYYKVINESDNIVTIYISDKKVDNNYHCWSHINEVGEEIDYCYMSAYFATNINGKLRSISGQTYTTGATCLTYEEAISYANANYSTNHIWNIGTYADHLLIMYLCMLIGKSTKLSTVFGTPIDINAATNILDDKGLFYNGKNPSEDFNYDGCTPNKIFGLESYRPQISYIGLCGLLSPSFGNYKVKLTYGNEDGSAANGYNLTGDGYLTGTALDTKKSTANSGFISKMSYKNTEMLPNIIGNGSSSTYYCVNLFNSGATSFGTVHGFSFQFVIPVSSKLSSIRFRLSCKPLN